MSTINSTTNPTFYKKSHYRQEGKIPQKATANDYSLINLLNARVKSHPSCYYEVTFGSRAPKNLLNQEKVCQVVNHGTRAENVYTTHLPEEIQREQDNFTGKALFNSDHCTSARIVTQGIIEDFSTTFEVVSHNFTPPPPKKADNDNPCCAIFFNCINQLIY